jgi:hypothetical protein
MEKFQKFLRDDSSNELVYDFEKADVTINGKRKERGRGCDYVVVSGNVRNCNLVLIECKGGELSISDFEDARRQLEYSIEFVKDAFSDSPDLAVLCYDQCKAQVVEYMRAPSNKWLRHGVRLIPLKSNAAKCRMCR